MKKKCLMLIMASIIYFNFAGCTTKEDEVNSEYNVQKALDKYKENVENEKENKKEDRKENAADEETFVEIEGTLTLVTEEGNYTYNRVHSNIRNAYQHIIDCYKKVLDGCKYDLIFFDNDDIPELVVSRNCDVSMYTFKDGMIYSLIDYMSFGSGGNHGYEYKEKTGIVFNYNTEYAGLQGYYSFFEISNDNSDELDYYLKASYEDENGNVIMVSSPEEIDEANWKFYYCQNDAEEIQISESEFDSYNIYNSDEFEMIIGRYTEEEIMEKLSSYE